MSKQGQERRSATMPKGNQKYNQSYSKQKRQSNRTKGQDGLTLIVSYTEQIIRVVSVSSYATLREMKIMVQRRVKVRRLTSLAHTKPQDCLPSIIITSSSLFSNFILQRHVVRILGSFSYTENYKEIFYVRILFLT